MLKLDTITASAYDEDGYLGLQVEPHGDSEGSAGMAHGHHPYGFFGRPLDPGTAENGTAYGAIAAHWKEGDDQHVLALEDPRDAEGIPEHSKGSSGQYNSRGAYSVYDYDTETFVQYIPMAGGTRWHRLTIGYETGREIYKFEHADGMLLEMVDDTVTITAPIVHVNSPNVLLGEAAGNKLSCVGDLVAVSIPPLICVTPSGPGTVMAATGLPTAIGGIAAVGQIISGRAGTKA